MTMKLKLTLGTIRIITRNTPQFSLVVVLPVRSHRASECSECNCYGFQYLFLGYQDQLLCRCVYKAQNDVKLTTSYLTSVIMSPPLPVSSLIVEDWFHGKFHFLWPNSSLKFDNRTVHRAHASHDLDHLYVC